MELKNKIEHQTDDEILSNLKRLNAEIIRRRRSQNTFKEPSVESSNSEEAPIKTRGRPKVGWRHKEDGKYDSHAVDPEYNKKYWQENYRKPFTCPICDTTLKTSGSNIQKHQRTLHCIVAGMKKEQAKENN